MRAIAGRDRRGSERAKSWVYAALNPLIDILPIERSYLRQGYGHVTFSRDSYALEVIRPPAEYLVHEGRIVLSDLERKHPALKRRLAAHATLIHDVEDAARQAYEALASSAELRVALVRQLKKLSRRERGLLVESDEELVAMSAEHLVNAVGIKRSIPPPLQKIWEGAEPIFRALSRASEIERFELACSPAAEDAETLLRWLQNFRYRICDEYDIPMAPVAIAPVAS